MRGTKPKRSPASRNFSQRSSSSKMRTSTSRVNRGRPNKDAATPPMMRPETFSDWSHAIRAPSVISGGRTGGFLATVGPAELCPSSPHFFHSVRAGLPPTEVLSPSQKRVQLPELACNRCPPQLLFLFGVDSVPPPLKGSSLRLSHLLFHMSGPHNTTLDDETLILWLVSFSQAGSGYLLFSFVRHSLAVLLIN